MSKFSFLLLHLFTIILLTDGTRLIVVNNCDEDIWPGILGTGSHETLNEGGFHLGRGKQVIIQAPDQWSGRVWARQGCEFDQNGNGTCQTGDCNGQLHCMGVGVQTPATLVEMTFGTTTNPMHYFDVSLIDGFNLPVSMLPIGGGRGCGVAACETDLNVWCPQNLVERKGEKVVGCKSACLAYKSDSYCCTGEYASPESCKPTPVGRFFKAVCPRAYSFAYDEASGLKTCRVANRYLITFCPTN